MIIPTTSKSPLSKEHSYPIGAQAISDALAHVPQFAQLDAVFYTFPKSRYDKSGRLLVLAAEYRHFHVGLSTANHMIETGWHEPRWHLVIYAVPRNKRRDVSDALMASGLRTVAQWLSEPRTETWLDLSHRLELEFNPKSNEMTARKAGQH